MLFNESRTVDEVEKLIGLAKLDSDDLENSSQALFLAQDLSPENVLLMEVNSKLLDDLLQGKSLVLRGGEDDVALMCSDDSTYEVRQAATSNALLLVPGLSLPNTNGHNKSGHGRTLIPREVCGIHRTYLEPRECQPKLHKLRKMLEDNLFKGPEHEPDNDKPNYCLEDLLNCVQATEVQIVQGLADIPAYLINGFYRILDFDYHWQILSFILDLIESSSWPLRLVPRQETIATLQELAPKEILEQCFDQFFKPSDNIDDDDDEDGDSGGFYQAKEDLICRYHAEVLLRNADKFHRQEFLDIWQKSVPEGMETDIKYLRGVALEDRSSKPEVIFFYPVWKLPEDIQGRLDALFTAKEKWTFDEIQPYIHDLCSSSFSESTLLTKYARCSTKNGVKLFNTKHPLKK